MRNPYSQWNRFVVCPAPFWTIYIFSQRWWQIGRAYHYGLWHNICSISYALWTINNCFIFSYGSRINYILIKLNNLLSHVIIIRFVLKRNYIFEQVYIYNGRNKKSPPWSKFTMISENIYRNMNFEHQFEIWLIIS